MMFDLQDFRSVNQGHGFDEGDRTLRSVAHLLASSVRPIDTVCRYSGDHFALVLPEIDSAHVEAVRQKIIKGLSELDLGGKQKALEENFVEVQFPGDGVTELELIRQLLGRIEKEKGKSRGASA